MRKYLAWLFLSFFMISFSVFAEEDEEYEEGESGESATVDTSGDENGIDNNGMEQVAQPQISPEADRTAKRKQVRSIVDNILKIRKKKEPSGSKKGKGRSRATSAKVKRQITNLKKAINELSDSLDDEETSSKSVRVSKETYRTVGKNGRTKSFSTYSTYSNVVNRGNNRKGSPKRHRNSHCELPSQSFYTVKKVNFRLAQPFVPQAIRKLVNAAQNYKKVEYKIKNWGENGTFRGSSTNSPLSSVYTVKNLTPKNYFGNKRKCCGG